ncbi:MAG TPA: HAD hydrolase-like protein [Oscillospiraceae bacterium]|nr:HAD hydrolase-like protein [Oscillospiraceae bacterium]HXK77697.1 HAD hydrolase-like protein [Oscillospiraceae bacterium]
MSFTYILFDLDGTLTDSFEGITKSFNYALKALCGYEENDQDMLSGIIGPPLRDLYIKNYGVTPELAEKLIEKYRERFSTVGLYENKVYDGVPEMLAALKEKGKVLALASAKPEEFCVKILRHFDLFKYFDETAGASLDGSCDTKEKVIEEAVRRLGLTEETKKEAVMVGDREMDILAAHEKGIAVAAVGYGYGREKELKACKPEFFVSNVMELEELLLH